MASLSDRRRSFWLATAALAAAVCASGCYETLDRTSLRCRAGQERNCPADYVCRGVGADGIGRCCRPDDLACGAVDASGPSTDGPGSGSDAADAVPDGARDGSVGLDVPLDTTPPGSEVGGDAKVDGNLPDVALDLPMGTGGSGGSGTGGSMGGGGSTATGGTGTGGFAGSTTGGTIGTGGTTHGTGGATHGTGGATPGTGGIPGTGGVTPGTGGIPGTGGVTPGTGGATPGTGGATPGTGGATGTGGGTGGWAKGNPPVSSAGCGKALATFRTGTNNYQMVSASLNRTYVVSIPDDYSPSHPYRLIFAMHPMGGSGTAVSSAGYYRLQPRDTGNTTIFVAPQGYSDSSPWRGADDKDHLFFDDMLAGLKGELCIDSSRVFVVGFSFGAMFANSLAQNHQKVLRGAVVYATALVNIYVPTNSGSPLAWMGTVGLSDGTCPPTMGRAARDRFVQNNGCTLPASVPEAVAGGSHVVYDYQCMIDYPVKWGTFDGGHTDNPIDPGQSATWLPAESWSFITQF
jgi:predicted esterase